MRGRWCWMLLAIGPALLCGAPEARAGAVLGPVVFVHDGVYANGLNEIVYDATRVKRERAMSAVVAADRRSVTFVDPEADIHLLTDRCELTADGARCALDAGRVQVNLGPASDRASFGGHVYATGGDGDDRLIGASEAHGGAGDDTIEAWEARGGDGNDHITCPAGPHYCSHQGEAGDDTMIGGTFDYEPSGGPGNDHLTGGNASDTLLGGAGSDVLDGGGGRDFTDYRDRVDRPVAVTFDGVRNDGEPGEHDLLVSIEGVHGSRPGTDQVAGDSPEGDRLTGGPEADSLYAMNGYANLRGLGGDDDLQMDFAREGRLRGDDGDDALYGVNATLEGGEGNDDITVEMVYYRGSVLYEGSSTVYGGGGDDRIYAGWGMNERYPDTISCGPGWDVVSAEEEDVVRLDCEVVTRDEPPEWAAR